MAFTWTWRKLLGLGASVIAGTTTLMRAEPVVDEKSILVSNITQESATVSWTTSEPSTSQVGLADVRFSDVYKRFPEPKGDASPMVTNHCVRLTGLLPGYDYGYILIVGDASGRGYRFPDGKTNVWFLKFHTQPFEAAGPTRFRIDLLGGPRVWAGSDLFVSVYPTPLAGKKFTLDFDEVKVDPPAPSIGVHLISGLMKADESKDFIINPKTKKPAVYNGLGGYSHSASYPIQLRLRTSANTPLGSYVATFTFSSDGFSCPVKYAFEVLPPPEKVQRKQIAEVPPIPGIGFWKKLMIEQAMRFGKLGEFSPFGYEGHVWYYDGGRAYLQVADFTHDKPTFVPFAQNLLNQYADYASHGAAGWRNFPHGLAMYYWRYGGERMKQGAIALSTKSAMALSGGTSDVIVQRETAYIINAYVKAAQLGEPENRLLSYSVNCALEQFDQIQTGVVFEQPFFDGLTFEALIGYYEYTAARGHPDERIPAAVKRMLDFMWEHVVDKKTGEMPLQSMIYEGYSFDSKFTRVTPGLNNLVVPAFAWYWNLSGEDTYRQRGDFLFEHALDEQKTEPFSSGKQFSQNYKASFDYVHYRSSATPVVSLTDPSNNPRDSEFHPDSTPPKISDIKVTTVGETATITWTTDKASSSQVRFGTTPKDMATVPANPADTVKANSRNVTSHSVKIEKLKPGTSYRFVVMSRDAVGNPAVSDEQPLPVGGSTAK